MILIKKAKKEDLNEISKLDVEIAQMSELGIMQLADSTQIWKMWIDKGCVFKAVDEGGSLLGVVVAISTNNKGYCIHKLLIPFDQESYSLTSELVTTLLIDRILKRVDKRESSVSIIVKPNEQTKISIYLSLGFSKKIYKKNYLGENEDRLILDRPINWADNKASNKILRLNKREGSQKNPNTNLTNKLPGSAVFTEGELLIRSMDSNNYLAS